MPREEILDFRRFGAVGDCVHNDTQAIQDAFNACQSTWGYLSGYGKHPQYVLQGHGQDRYLVDPIQISCTPSVLDGRGCEFKSKNGGDIFIFNCTGFIDLRNYMLTGINIGWPSSYEGNGMVLNNCQAIRTSNLYFHHLHAPILANYLLYADLRDCTVRGADHAVILTAIENSPSQALSIKNWNIGTLNQEAFNISTNGSGYYANNIRIKDVQVEIAHKQILKASHIGHLIIENIHGEVNGRDIAETEALYEFQDCYNGRVADSLVTLNNGIATKAIQFDNCKNMGVFDNSLYWSGPQTLALYKDMNGTTGTREGGNRVWGVKAILTN